MLALHPVSPPGQTSLTTLFPSLAASLKGVRPRLLGTMSRGTDWSNSASRAIIRSMAWHAIVLLGCRIRMWSTVLPGQKRGKVKYVQTGEGRKPLKYNKYRISAMHLGNPGPWCWPRHQWSWRWCPRSQRMRQKTGCVHLDKWMFLLFLTVQIISQTLLEDQRSELP